MMIYLLSFLGIDNWWPAIIAPLVLLFLALLIKGIAQKSYNQMMFNDRLRELKGHKKKEYGFFNYFLFRSPYGTTYYKKEDYNIEDETVISRLLNFEKNRLFTMVIHRIVSIFFLLMISVFLVLNSKEHTLLLIPIALYFIILFYDIIIIIKSNYLSNRRKIIHIILSLIIPYIYSGVICSLYHNYKGVQVLKKRLNKLKVNQQ